ncbi:N-formimino-L-glutamate deiminase [Nocardioides sp. Root190]|uniref:formimidoylglutamate deiminase n=1 Tax=Nocardioides sp. Root190 TaxID=1736488 RepID=UPI0006F64E69|nr:formimidoylglutamate deiminase [Nocardioides sp. Root190]KRB73000.1 N-formimino-L-glutamate deiminase [Nocardioides sp. Root190]
MTSYLLEHAWIEGRVRDTVRVEIEDGRFTQVEPDSQRPATPVRGLTLPGLANTHSHAFHRALRGRAQREGGTFWTWRDQMYDVAGRLTPDDYYDLARATYAEMVAAGHTSVGEFHYLHHQSDGRPYDDANAMGHAVIAAARDVGIRITLLDTVYLSSGFGAPVEGVQRRFSDGDAEQWLIRRADLADELAGQPGVCVGAAVHSVRAVPREQLAAAAVLDGDLPLHVHLSEQVAENDECLARHGVTPTRLLADAGLLGATTSVVHATHLTDADIELLAQRCGFISICPTTERDLGDGIGPTDRLRAASCTELTLGSDSHAVIDPFEEMRALELNERLATRARGGWTAAQLLQLGTLNGHVSLDWADAGQIAVGCRADLVTLDLVSPRTAGTGADEHTAVFAATASDVTQVVIDGRLVFDGDHGRVGRELGTAIGKVWA